MADSAPKHMTVAELIKELQKVPQHMPVAISVDGEGNRYKYLDEVTQEAFENQGGMMLQRIFNGQENNDDAPVDTVVIWPIG